MSGEIPVYRGGRIVAWAKVDANHHAGLSHFRWRLDDDGYARRAIRVEGQHRTIYMHRQILGLAHGDKRQCDHINRDRLDNQRANLRVTTAAENSQNIFRQTGTSRFRGVAYNRRNGKWQAHARVHYRRHHLGWFDTELEAARAAAHFRRTHMPYSQEALAA